MKPKLGSCYYPEHWPEERWQKDAEEMVAAGLSWVRIGEFAWSRLEPEQGIQNFDWLDRAISILGNVGLNIVMSTPTAAPPRWVVDKWPDMLLVDEKEGLVSLDQGGITVSLMKATLKNLSGFQKLLPTLRE